MNFVEEIKDYSNTRANVLKKNFKNLKEQGHKLVNQDVDENFGDD